MTGVETHAATEGASDFMRYRSVIAWITEASSELSRETGSSNQYATPSRPFDLLHFKRHRPAPPISHPGTWKMQLSDYVPLLRPLVRDS